MPTPGSHKYDIKRTRLRNEYDNGGVPDEHADRAANEELQRDDPARPLGDPERAAGPSGTRGSSRGDPDIDDPPRALAGEIELRSAAFNDHTLIPDRYSYDGGNMSPPLEWGGIPDDTVELVLLCEDPDAPSGTFTHWVVTNISPATTGVAEGERAGPSWESSAASGKARSLAGFLQRPGGLLVVHRSTQLALGDRRN